MRDYHPRGMPSRFLEGAPDIVRKGILDIIENKPLTICQYDVILREGAKWSEVVGLDFDKEGFRGCHFFLTAHEMRDYRERNRRKRVAWKDLPAATQAAIVDYLQED